MTDTATTEKPQSEFVIETFTCGPNVRLNGIAAWLERVAAEGFELVTAYAVPHPTGNIILHHFVVQKRAEPEPSNGAAKINEPPKGKGRR
jgi:hypothetical protein